LKDRTSFEKTSESSNAALLVEEPHTPEEDEPMEDVSEKERRLLDALLDALFNALVDALRVFVFKIDLPELLLVKGRFAKEIALEPIDI
jgi:hypothetical protein